MTLIYSLIGFILAIGILVAVHEFGHFWVARKLGVKVLTFSIGFGKPIWSKVAGDDQIEYRIARIPLGGYVKMLGEGSQQDPIPAHEAHRAFDNQPVWKRACIVAAGPGINFLFAVIVFMGLGMIDKQRVMPVFGDVPEQSVIGQLGVRAGDRLIEIDGRPVQTLLEHDLYLFNQVLKRAPVELVLESNGRTRQLTIETTEIPIYRINPQSLMRLLGFVEIAPPDTTEIELAAPDSPAANAGIQKGDRIVAIDGQSISSWRELGQRVSPSAGQAMNFTIERDGVRFDKNITPAAHQIGEQEVGRLGVQRVFIPYPPEQLVTISRGPLQALSHGARQTWEMSTLIMRMLGKMATLQVSHQNVNGPIMIADVAGKAIQVGPAVYLYFLALISISLGVMNLLPIPMLDGGHLASYVIEVFAGKELAQKAFIAMQPLGLVMLAGLMSLAFYNDILRILN